MTVTATDIAAPDALANVSGSIVYYVRRGALIKIGKTANPADRFRDLLPDEILAIEPGGRTEEAARHRQFAHLRSRAEYFRDERELREHIERMRSMYGDPDPRWPTMTRKAPAKDRKVPAKADSSRMCPQHHCLRSECPSYSTHVYAVRLQRDLVDEVEAVLGAAGYLDLSDFIRQAVEQALREAVTEGPDSASARARTDAAPAWAELAEIKRRLRIAVGNLNSILDAAGEPAVVADLAAPEQAAPGSVTFRKP